MASKQANDENDDESEEVILIRVYINKNCFQTNNFDTEQDVWKIAEIERGNIDMDSLRDDIPVSFRKAKAFKALFKNENEYEWKVYEYEATKAEVEIEDTDDLETTIMEFVPADDGNADDDDLLNKNKYLKLRVVFFKKSEDDSKENDDKSESDQNQNDANVSNQTENNVINNEQEIVVTSPKNNNSHLSEAQSDFLVAPKLNFKRFRYFFNGHHMAITVELKWNSLPKTTSSAFTYEIKENLHYSAEECVCQVIDKTSEILSDAPLEVATKYEFQIKVFSDLHSSQWSKPLFITTPPAPNKLPPPKYLQITTLLPKMCEIKWNPMFAHAKDDKILYTVKEDMRMFNDVSCTIPTGQLSELNASTEYKISVCSMNVSNSFDVSMPSKAVSFCTPSVQFWQNENYKPLPPQYIEQSVDEQFNEIILFWSLPPNTFGTNIYYKILDLPSHSSFYPLHELPFRWERPLNDLDIRIVTVTHFNSNEYESNPIHCVLKGYNSNNDDFMQTPRGPIEEKEQIELIEDNINKFQSNDNDNDDNILSFDMGTIGPLEPLEQSISVIVEEHQFSLNVDYIHDAKPSKNIVFDKQIKFESFKQRIVDQLNIHVAMHDDLQIGYVWNENIHKLIRMNADNFESILPQMTDSNLNIRIYVGLEPIAPTIESIRSDMTGQFNIILKPTVQNTFHFAITPANPSDAVSLNSSDLVSRSLNMIVNGLKPTAKYAVRVKASNVFGESAFSSLSEFRYPAKNREKRNLNDGDDMNDFTKFVVDGINHSDDDENMEKIDGVVKANPSVRYIFFFSDKSLTDSNYCFNPFGTDEYHPFYVVDQARSAYLCIYQDRTSKDARSDLIFNIVAAKYKGSKQEQKIKKVKNNDAFPKQNAQTLTWCVPGNQWVFFVDFENYSSYTYNAKQKHYEGIAKSIMEFSLNLIGQELSPLAVLRIIFSSWAYFTSQERLLLKRQIARNVFSHQLKLCLVKIRAVKSWKEMSTLLVCLAALWPLETQSKQNMFIGSKEMAEIYSYLISLKRGSIHELLENVQHCFGEYNAYMMSKLTTKILEERTQIRKYGYCLWYNLFHCVHKDPKSENKEKIQNELKNTTLIQHLFTLVGYDLTFVGHNRAIKMEYNFVRCLLNSRSTGTNPLSSRVKYDFVMQVLMKLPEIEQVYSFLYSFKDYIKFLIGTDNESWFAFVHYMLNICKIPKNSKDTDLQLSGAIIKCMGLLSEMYCFCVEEIDQQKDAESLYKLCDNYPIIMDEKVRQSILKNEYLISRIKFVPFIANLLKPEFAKDTWKETLIKCIGVWLNFHGLTAGINIIKNYHLDAQTFEEYCVGNDISRHIPAELDKKFEMITNPSLPNEIRRIVALSITTTWKLLNTQNDRKLIMNGVVFLLQNDDLVDVADTILRNVIGKENPFNNQNDVSILTYLINPIGKAFINLLSALRRTKNYNQLSIQDRLAEFHRFWIAKLTNIAQKSTQVSVVDILSKGQLTNFNNIHTAFLQSGGIISSSRQKECERLFAIFNKAKLFKQLIDEFFRTFAPSNNYWAQDIKELHRVYAKLKNWHDLSLNAITDQNWALVGQNSKLLKAFQELAKSKICVSIWRALIAEHENQWNVKQLRAMTTYEIADWIRSKKKEFVLRSADFNIEILVQIIYDRELTGRQLHKDEIDRAMLQKWFSEWNQSNRGAYSEYIPNPAIEEIIDVFFQQFEAKKALDRKVRSIGPGDKKFDMKKMQSVYDTLRKEWNLIITQITQNCLTVSTIQKYFAMLARENNAAISTEIQFMLRSMDKYIVQTINIESISKSIVMVFECISALESAKTVRDATMLFQSILRDHQSDNNQYKIVEDPPWKARLKVIETDILPFSIYDIQSFWAQYKDSLPLLNETSKKWLIAVASNRKCITQLYTKFNDDAQFERHMQIFGANDPIQQTRAISLTNVRNLIIGFLKRPFRSFFSMSNELRDLCTKITADDLQSLEIVVTSWNHLLIDTFDATQFKFQQDKELLAQLTQFTFAEEAKQEKDGGLTYLQVILGEEEQNNEDEEKRNQMLSTLTQNEFDAFTDRLLMFMAGDQGNVNCDAPIRPIGDMSVNDVVDLFKARESNLIQCGVQHFSDLEQILRVNEINGPELIKAFKESKHDLMPMNNLLFGQQQLYEQEKQEKIANEIIKVIDFQLLRDQVQNDLIPKFDICKKIAKHRLLYYSEGGRDKLDENRHIPIEKNYVEFEIVDNLWTQYVEEWEQKIEKLRQDFNVLTFYTVNDMRWILAKIDAYINQGAGAEKDKFLRELYSAFCFIDSSLNLEECKSAISSWQQKPETMRHLGKSLQSAFGGRTMNVACLNEFEFQFLASGKPHLFLCQQPSAVLRTVMKLFLSQGQQPAASRVLFCTKTTTLEEIECLLMRSNLRLDEKNMNKSKKQSSVGPLLHVLVQPERLEPEIQDGFLKIMSKYVYKNWALFAIVTADARNKIYFQLQAFANYTQRAFTETERRNFFKHILCSNLDEFNKNANKAPLCGVYMSTTECVGKSHVIRQIANDSKHGLVHVPINTKAVDLDFIVDRLLSVPENVGADTKIIYHINVSSDAGMQVNEVMFQLLVLRYLKKSGGGSFNANCKHAFLVELPSQLSSTLKATNIDDVREYFYFLAGSKSHGILKYEVQDSLRPNNVEIIDDEHVISNQLELTPKEMFVLKYLDAFDTKKLIITGNVANNWDHTKHPNINNDRMMQLVSKYCEQGASSLVFLKSFLRYMYRQFIQLYTASNFVDNSLSFAVDGKKRFIQYHQVIAESMIQSAPHIACHMYELPKLAVGDNEEKKEENKEEENENESKMLDETTGDEEFFLVKYWAKTETPMVLMNQRPINESFLINVDRTTLEQDLESARRVNTSTFSLLAMNLDKNDSFGANEWKLFRDVMKQAKSLKWNLYNFESDRKERMEQLKLFGFANETSTKQMEKLRLLLRICGGFKSNDPKKQETQLKKLYDENKDYALTFDNILKIVAIFFRVNSGIPVLIMGETGCGKTKLLQFMSTALDIDMRTIDVHGGYTIGDLQRDLTEPIQFALANPTNTVLVFLDEVNTSPDCGGFKEVICDHSLKGVEFPDNMVIIAALNPYRKRHKTKEQIEEEKLADLNNPRHFVDDLDRQMGSLVYRVFPLPPSLKTYVWNFGALSQMDEQQYIAVMTRTTWDDEDFLRECPYVESFKELRNCFIDLICQSQHFLRIELNDKSVCSLRDVRRANKLFLWFFMRANRKKKQLMTRITESMFLSIAQCYYYRLNQRQRKKYQAKIEKMVKHNLKKNIEFNTIIDAEQWQYVKKLRIEPGIAINRAFRENLFVMLVGLSTKTPTVIVGKPGSSKTLAMVTLQDNLSSATKNEKLTSMGFDDYFVVSFQCSKLTTASSIEQRWKFAEDYEERLNERRDTKNSLPRSVIMFLDEVGLAEQSPHRPLKILHKLLEHPKIAFIGLSNWQLDSAKMNRVVLHNVLPPNQSDLQETATKIMNGAGTDMNMLIARHLIPRIPQIAGVYESIMQDKDHNPFRFDFFGHRDFYNLVSYLKYRLQQKGVSLKDDDVLVEAVLRNFGGETKEQCEEFLFPKIAEKILSSGSIDTQTIWKKFSCLQLIRDNIRQTRDNERSKSYELRNIMLITESAGIWKILFDAGVLGIAQTEVIFGSKFKNDIGSTIYLYRTIEKVRGAMQTGKVCVLLKLETLYDSLYDVLNQRYLNVDNQKFCRICIGGESIRCQIHQTFRCIVVVPRQEAHHLTENTDDFTPVAFLNRFEKQYLDPSLLREFGIGNDWAAKWQQLQAVIMRKYSDHLRWRNKELFIGFNKTYTFVSLLTTEMASEHIEQKMDNDADYVLVENQRIIHQNAEVAIADSVDNCYGMLLKTTSIEYLIQDQRKLRKRDFVAYASLIDLLQREGVQTGYSHHMLLRVLTHDTYQLPLDFIHDNVEVTFDNEEDDEKCIEYVQKLHVLKFKEITSFMREVDFYNVIYDFFNNSETTETTLIIVCDPANSTEKLVHYLHAQHLTEKARAAATQNHQNKKEFVPKNVVFLIYMSRQSPYPLIFNREWKHLFLDALLPANHRTFPQIQINDINIFEADDQRKFEERVQHHTDRIVYNSYEKAMNNVVVEKSNDINIRDEIERIKGLLNVDHNNENIADKGAFRIVLVERIQKVLTDKNKGAIDCLKKTLKNRERNDRGSIRAHVMEKLAEKIKDQLVEILTIIFSNGNSKLYFGQSQMEEYQSKRMAKLWLKLVSEPRILRISSNVHAKQSRVSIDRTLNQAQFPFSSHIHSYLSCYKDDCLRAWNDEKVPIISSGVRGQQQFTTELQNKLHASNLSVPIDNLPENLVRKLSKDIVLLESTRLGLRRHGPAIFERLCKFVESFLWKSSNDVHEYALRARKPRKNKKPKKVAAVPANVNDNDDGFVQIDAQYDDDDEDDDDDEVNDIVIGIDSDDEEEEEENEENNEEQKTESKVNADNDEDKEEEKDEIKQDLEEEEEDEVEEQTVQIHEIYATLWANEKIILQCVDVLSVLKESPAQLASINRKWTNDRNLGDCLGEIMAHLLDEVRELLIQATSKGLKDRVDYLLSTSQSFEDLLMFLASLNYNRVISLREKWNMIRLSMICVSACPGGIQGTFINSIKQRFGDHRFDSLPKLGALIQNISDALRSQNIGQVQRDETLQWFTQNYIRFFAFSAQEINNQFAQSLISVIAEENDTVSDDLTIKPNSFTKFEIASQFLSVIESNQTVKAILSQQVQSRELKSLIASLLSRAHEQKLHGTMRRKYQSEAILAPKKKEVVAASNKLHQSFEGTKLEQLLAISECKVILFYFIRYLQSILDAKGQINVKGVWYQGKQIKKPTYLNAIGAILSIPQNNASKPTQHIQSIKQGLQYFFVSEIWNMGGAQKAMALISKPVFPKLLGIELFKDDILDDAKQAECIPKDDIFQLALSNIDDAKQSDDYRIVYQSFENAALRDGKIKTKFEKKYFVLLFGAIFKRAYLRFGSKQFEKTINYINTAMTAEFAGLNKTPIVKKRVVLLLSNMLTNNSPEPRLRLKKNRSLEEVQMIRLCYHFISVILAVPISQFSRLFHLVNCEEMKREYLVGMPEDSSAALFKVMAGCGVWLCPNDHIYFVNRCTATNESGTCKECGAPIGNLVGGKSHTAAKGNRRIGKIDKNGVIKPDNPYGGATEGMAEYNAEKLAPKGYVLVEGGGDEIIRGLNECSVQIVRWMLNAILFLHASEPTTSKADSFLSSQIPQKDEITKKLKIMMTKCVKSLQNKLNLSYESVMYLMHQIIDNFHRKYPKQTNKKFHKAFQDPKVRASFEIWLVSQCIKPCIQSPAKIISAVRKTVTASQVVLKWAKRFGEQMDIHNTEEGREFAKQYHPNIFLPFRLLTLSTFKEKLLKNEENRMLYPVTWGILNTIDTSSGYSVFALKYLPFMITWMKLLFSRLNQRLNLDDVLNDPDKYSCKWVMDKCKNEKWGDSAIWMDAFNGFVAGWNHLAHRVTTDRNLEDVPIDTVQKDDIRELNEVDGDEEKEESEKTQFGIARKNQFKKFIKIANVCEALPIKAICAKATKRKEILPVDVPLIYGLDTGIDGKLDTSIMIRKMIQHYISVNNRVLRECYQLNDEISDEDKLKLGLLPGLDSTHISRSQDVVDIDEESFHEIIQECTQQKLKYGDAVPYTLNLRLLETRLRERYITGRKFLVDSPIEFEFAGQSNIPQVVSKINRSFGNGDENIKYFEKSPVSFLNIIKLNILQQAAANQRILEAYNNALQAVEQTLIALERQRNLASNSYNLGSFMKDNLHLYPQEFDPFIRIQQLQLKHLEHIWRYLERAYLIEEGRWHEIPQSTMELYKNDINELCKTALMQFITRHEMDTLWLFLSAYRRFLSTMCRTPLDQNPDKQRLRDFLQYAEDIDEELMYVFPEEIMLHQAGYAYFHAAKYYQERNDREAREQQQN